jgi:hypothetical protein
MKTKGILSLLGLTLIAVSPTTWAAGHGGGGGGFRGGGFRGGGRDGHATEDFSAIYDYLTK